MATCEHIQQVTPSDLGRQPNTPGACEECLAGGQRWVHLRMCLECGHVGCCDSSKARHATRHFEETGHAVMRSIERGEPWMWCYADRQKVAFRT